MGNNPAKREPRIFQGEKNLNKVTATTEAELESESFVNDKVKILPSQDFSFEPNPITTNQVQRRQAKRNVVKRVLYRNALCEQYVIAANHNGLNTDLIDFIDDNASKVPRIALNSFRELRDYLKEPIPNHPESDILLIRSFIIWLSDALGHDTVEDLEPPPSSPLSYRSAEGQGRTPDVLVRLLRQHKTTCTTIFILLCWAAGIKCDKISGVCRSDDGSTLLPCAWVAVFIKDTWQLVHPYRICRTLSGNISKDMIKSYTDVHSDTNEILKKTFLDHYVLSNPEHFIHECFPDDEKWQLLLEPITKEQFLDQDMFFPPWWRTGLKLTTHLSHRITCDDGRSTLGFMGTYESVYELVLWYNLELIETDLDIKIENDNFLQNFVYLIRNESTWTCDILFPYTGTYKLVFYAGKYGEPLLKILAVDIDCKVCHPEPMPLPINTGAIGLGPGPFMYFSGLSHPSYRSGILHIDLSRHFQIKFRMDNRMSELISIKANVLSSEATSNHSEDYEVINELTQCCLIRRRTYKEVVIDVFPPESPGQYILQICTETNGYLESETKTACYYLLIYDELPLQESHENCGIRAARKMLNASIEGKNVNEILFRIQDCASKKITEVDLDVQRARGKAAILNIKQKKLHRGRKVAVDPRLHHSNIVRQSEYEARLHRLINLLERLIYYLQHGDSSETWATVSRPQSVNKVTVEKSNAVNQTVNLLLTLFSKSDEKEKDTVWLIEELSKELKQHGFILLPEDIRRTMDLMEDFTFNHRVKIASDIFKCVNEIVTLLISEWNALER
ncbi:unnamed protein product [Mytilus edulis]|uniref:KY-like immunoglobulin-like domain-containing protein n=1 Tax=Mytilus edulis TaxID=6550 RepID=A0A8S3RMG8_MYTED|nr:unnamed protein product [Mytilus edulis]